MGDRVNAAIEEALRRAYVAKLFDGAEYAAEDILPLSSIRAITAKYTVLPGPNEMGYRPYYYLKQTGYSTKQQTPRLCSTGSEGPTIVYHHGKDRGGKLTPSCHTSTLSFFLFMVTFGSG